MFKIHINDGENEIPNENVVYVIAQDGIFIKRKFGLFVSQVKIDKISILEPTNEYALMNIKKIPGKDFAKMIAFFKKVYEMHRGEAAINIYYHEKKKNFKLRVPSQQVTAGNVNYVNYYCNDNYLHVGTIHSHGNGSAFHSGGDQSDEKNFDGIHITIGKITDPCIDISCSLMANGQRFQVDPGDYIDDIEIHEYEVEDAFSNYSYLNFFNKTMNKNIKKQGWKLNVPDSYFTFPSEWMEFVNTLPIRQYKNTTKTVTSVAQARAYSPYGIYDLYGDYVGGYQLNNCRTGDVCDSCPHYETMVQKVLEDYGILFEDDEDEDDDQLTEENTND